MPYLDAMIFDCNNKQTTKAILTWTRIQGLSNRIRSLLCLIDCSCVTVSSHESIWNTAFKLCLHRIECCWFASAHPIGWRAPRDATMFFLGGTWSHLLFPSTFQFTSCVVLLESNFTYVGCYFLLFLFDSWIMSAIVSFHQQLQFMEIVISSFRSGVEMQRWQEIESEEISFFVSDHVGLLNRVNIYT